MKKSKTLSNYDYFLKLDTSPYKGKWIAIAKGKIAASSLRADIAFRAAKQKYSPADISLAKVPREESLVLKIQIK
jgi:hypothetical protein